MVGKIGAQPGNAREAEDERECEEGAGQPAFRGLPGNGFRGATGTSGVRLPLLKLPWQ